MRLVCGFGMTFWLGILIWSPRRCYVEGVGGLFCSSSRAHAALVRPSCCAQA